MDNINKFQSTDVHGLLYLLQLLPPLCTYYDVGTCLSISDIILSKDRTYLDIYISLFCAVTM